jgi:hypothetical protein
MSDIPLTFSSPVDLIASGVKIGDQILITDAPVNMFSTTVDPETQFLVTAITSSTGLTYDGFLQGIKLGLALGSATGTPTYTIVHNLTKDEQVAEIINYATNIADKRVVLVWPPEAEVLNADGTTSVVDGTFIAACLASAKSAYPAQQGFTNFPIPGPYKLHYSNTYFTKTQLTALINAGIMVFTQDVPGNNISALRQVTTDPSSFENFELSCVTTVDKVSADLISIFKPYIGPYNITQDYLGLLSSIGDQYMYQAKSQKSPKCGSLVLNGTIDSILANIGGTNPTIPDGTVQINASIEVGKPANWIKIQLYVS